MRARLARAAVPVVRVRDLVRQPADHPLVATVYDDQGRRLPHPDVPCAWCGEYEMGWNACPNAKDICTDCCGED